MQLGIGRTDILQDRFICFYFHLCVKLWCKQNIQLHTVHHSMAASLPWVGYLPSNRAAESGAGTPAPGSSCRPGALAGREAQDLGGVPASTASPCGLSRCLTHSWVRSNGIGRGHPAVAHRWLYAQFVEFPSSWCCGLHDNTGHVGKVTLLMHCRHLL